MIAEAGHYALVLALALALVQSIVPIIGVRLREPTLMAVAGSTAESSSPVSVHQSFSPCPLPAASAASLP